MLNPKMAIKPEDSLTITFKKENFSEFEFVPKCIIN
jgi:hypothetical protein